jgi:hypothetical protein
MNFQSALEELNKLYEAVEEPTAEEVAEEEVEDKKLTEAAAEEEAEDEEIVIEDDEAEEEAEPEELEAEARFVLECVKCGGLIIKAEADVKIDEEADLANVGEECQYCGEAEGHKVLGTLVPYGVAEAEVEEPVVED